MNKNRIDLSVCGTKRCDINEVRNVKTPEATESWRPIGHDFLVNKVQTQIETMDGKSKTPTIACTDMDNAILACSTSPTQEQIRMTEEQFLDSATPMTNAFLRDCAWAMLRSFAQTLSSPMRLCLLVGIRRTSSTICRKLSLALLEQ